MSVLLGSKGYAGYLPATVCNLSTNIEAALIAQGLATASTVASTTTGAVTANVTSGICAIAAAASSVVITNNLIDANSKVIAYVSQAAADGTLLRVERVVCTSATASVPAFFTIFGTANATATTIIAWTILFQQGETALN